MLDSLENLNNLEPGKKKRWHITQDEINEHGLQDIFTSKAVGHLIALTAIEHRWTTDYYDNKPVKLKKREYPKFTIILPKRTADTEAFFTKRLREELASKAMQAV